MRIIFLVIMLLHGVIHLLGFVKGLRLRELKELSLPISKPMGILWLIAGLLFVLYGISHYNFSKWSWLPGIAAVLLSQTLVVLYWKDAKYGSIVNVIVLVVALIDLGHDLIKADFTKKVLSDFAGNNDLSPEILSETDMVHLPAVVQKYLHYTRSVGQPKVKNFRAEFTGGMRGKPEEDYMNFHSVQYNFYHRPSRYFFMEASKIGLPATGLHTYQNETATFRVKMMNWVKVVDAKGDKLNQAETVTLFNDMCFIAPASLIDNRITWEIVNDTVVKGSLKNGAITVSALLYFNDKGELINFISTDRYETDGVYYHNFPWETPVENYRMMEGYLLPGRAKLIYKKPEGDFLYGELEFKSVKYNLRTFED